jgi:hypothetical protein
VRIRPARLNAAIAGLFVVGSSCFVLGSVPAYLNAVGGVVDGVTYFVGSLFFTSASFLQLVQAQSPATTKVTAASQDTPAQIRLWNWLPHDRGWLAAITQFPGTIFFNISTFVALAHNLTVSQQDRHVWRPDFYGSTLFLAASVFGILAVGRFLSFAPRSYPWCIAWLNMIGSILFMASALAAYILPSTGDPVNLWISVAGTLLGAGCFLIGAAFLIPAWRTGLPPAAELTRLETP